MAAWALGIYGFFLAFGFGLRTVVHRTRTGRSPLVRPASGLAWLCEGMFGLGNAGIVLGPVLDLAGALERLRPLDRVGVHAAGFVIAAAGVGTALAAQVQMGRSWRAGVDPAERTELVTSGLFRIMRNPVYTSMLLASAGIALLVPNIVALGGLALSAMGAEILVRLVEEPHLLRVHGPVYGAYASRTGRFLPSVGRLKDAG